jgi:hypothetical protein
MSKLQNSKYTVLHQHAQSVNSQRHMLQVMSAKITKWTGNIKLAVINIPSTDDPSFLSWTMFIKSTPRNTGSLLSDCPNLDKLRADICIIAAINEAISSNSHVAALAQLPLRSQFDSFPAGAARNLHNRLAAVAANALEYAIDAITLRWDEQTQLVNTISRVPGDLTELSELVSRTHEFWSTAEGKSSTHYSVVCSFLAKFANVFSLNAVADKIDEDAQHIHMISVVCCAQSSVDT